VTPGQAGNRNRRKRRCHRAKAAARPIRGRLSPIGRRRRPSDRAGTAGRRSGHRSPREDALQQLDILRERHCVCSRVHCLRADKGQRDTLAIE
jgi:hypothetical protein